MDRAELLAMPHVSDHEYFTEGYCHALALALHHRTKWQIVKRTIVFYGTTGQLGVRHMLVRRPDGLLLDITGLTEQERDIDLIWSNVTPREIYRWVSNKEGWLSTKPGRKLLHRRRPGSFRI